MGLTRGIVCVLVLAATCAAAWSAPAGAQPVAGIDVSRFQGKIKWKRVAGKGRIGFAFVQASRGSGADCATAPDRCGADEFYARNINRARAFGVRVGPYHRAFAGGDTVAGAIADATVEAELFIGEVEAAGGLRSGDLRPALDVETPFGGLNATELTTWVRTWLDHVQAALGVKPVIYTNASSWQATGNTTEFALDGNPLWVAHWGVAAPSVPAGYWGGAGWSVWQYSSSGHVKGIKGNVDLDRLGPAGFAVISVP
jgi:GH25 family lysozyme M1 (1,4-beta-N-acetylmuramidase)